MNQQKILDSIPYKIKVNKKFSNNNIYTTQNFIINSFNNTSNSSKFYHMNTYIPSINYDKNNSSLTPNSNNYIINTKILKTKTNSNSEEKVRKKNLNINIYDEQKHKDANILEDLINNKYLQPILESQDIDEKLYNCNLKEPVKNSFNVSLNDFFNRKGKYYINFKTPKIEISNKRGKGLSIKTQSFNNTNNNFLNDMVVHNNRTLENNNNYNNYFNNIKMTNNYYNNNEINLLNVQSYNNNIMHFSSEGKRIKDLSYSDNNPLIYYSYERNKNMYKNRHNAYINNKVNNINNIQYLNKENYYNNNNFNKLNSPLTHYFKSQTYTLKSNNHSNNSYYKQNKSSFNNKEINIRNLADFNDLNSKNKSNNNIYENVEDDNNKYNNIKNIIKENNSNKKNKYDYNKKLFDIYRGKLLNEFFRHIEKAIKKYIYKIFKFFINILQELNPLNKIDEIFIPKISLGKSDKLNDNTNIIRTSANLKKQKYANIFYSEKKKFPQKHNYIINKNNINLLNLTQVNPNNKKISNVNKSYIINEENKLEKLPKNNIISKYEKRIYSKERKNTNSNITVVNRNSLVNPNDINNNNISNNYNIRLISNSSLNQYIYKKKIRLSKNITFVNKLNINNNNHNYNNINKNTEINKDDILSNSKGKIIDIDINLGKPIKEISDINPLENLFINDYTNKRFKSSLSSTNKREKKKKKHKSKSKSKNKKLSLPKKKYLEEKYDIYPIKNSDEDIEDNLYNNINNSFDNNLNNIISLNNSCNIAPNHNYFTTFINNKNDNDNDNNNNKNIDNKNKKKNYRNILVKNIKTSDKRLFIHINYIFSLSKKKNKNNKSYDINTLLIKRNIFFSLIKKNYDNKHQNKNKYLSKNKIIQKTNYRNHNYCLEKENEKINKTNYIKNNKDKYLFSCVKFIIKIINKIVVKKNYIYFKNALEEKNNKNKKNNNGNGKHKINTYKKKISKNKV